MLRIRKADSIQDYDGIWAIFHHVLSNGDTYVFPVDTPKSDLAIHWFAAYMRTFVVVDGNNKILGSYIIKPNQIGLGSHIANCSYIVHPDGRGQGIGGMMCAHSIVCAKEEAYLGIQFNIVVSTNVAAVHLWQKYGFRIIGTTPFGFMHKELGLVDTYIMFKDLRGDAYI